METPLGTYIATHILHVHCLHCDYELMMLIYKKTNGKLLLASGMQYHLVNVLNTYDPDYGKSVVSEENASDLCVLQY